MFASMLAYITAHAITATLGAALLFLSILAEAFNVRRRYWRNRHQTLARLNQNLEQRYIDLLRGHADTIELPSPDAYYQAARLREWADMLREHMPDWLIAEPAPVKGLGVVRDIADGLDSVACELDGDDGKLQLDETA